MFHHIYSIEKKTVHQDVTAGKWVRNAYKNNFPHITLSLPSASAQKQNFVPQINLYNDYSKLLSCRAPIRNESMDNGAKLPHFTFTQAQIHNAEEVSSSIYF